jgi:hypothetical protein
MCTTVTNTLAYYTLVLSTLRKSFIVQAFEKEVDIGLLETLPTLDLLPLEQMSPYYKHITIVKMIIKAKPQFGASL